MIRRDSLKPVTALLSLAAVAYTLHSAGFGTLTPMLERPILLALLFPLVFLTFPATERCGERAAAVLLDIALAVACVVVFLYAAVNADLFLDRTTEPKPLDMVMGMVAVLLVIEACRRTSGWAIPALVAVSLLYARFGDVLPGMWGHPSVSLTRVVALSYMYNEGMFGALTGIAARFLIVLLIFGAVLNEFGAARLFIAVSEALLGRFRGGGAKIAVVASSLFGMISGSAVANVGAIGPLTIPLIRKSGYNARYAAAVEASASVGGQIMPPVMGAAVFIMSDLLGVPYIKIAVAAALPAIFYYLSLFMSIDLAAGRHAFRGMAAESLPRLGRVVGESWYTLIPPAVLVYLLAVEENSPGMAAFWALVSVVAIEVVRELWKEGTVNVGRLLSALERGVQGSLIVVTILAAVGILVGMVNITGLAINLSWLLIDAVGGNLLALLFLTMIASLVLGTALPTVPTYLIVAILVAPSLVKMGIKPLAAHLFVFYFGVLADITPPTAMTVAIACGISGSRFMTTCWTAVRVAFVGFAFPFLFVYSPAFLLNGSPFEIFGAIGTGLTFVTVLAAAFEGFLLTRLNAFRRALAAAAAVFILGAGVAKHGELGEPGIFALVGWGAAALLALIQILDLWRQRASALRRGAEA